LSHFEDHSPSRIPDEPTAHLIVDVATKFSKRRIYNRCKKKIDSVLRLVYRAPDSRWNEDLHFWPVAAIRGNLHSCKWLSNFRLWKVTYVTP